MISQHPSGWYLPKDDTYFSQFIPGQTPRKNGFMRDHLLEAFKYVKNWNYAVDVGAHVGFWASDMATRFKKVYAFEPNADNYACLVKNVDSLGNVETFNMAVGNDTTACTIERDEMRVGNTGAFYARPNEHGDTIMIRLRDMDLEGCDLLKVDVEGYELRVLEGARRLIKTHKPVIIMECTDTKFYKRYGIPVGSAEKWLIDHGYREVSHMRPDKVFVHAA